jgi:hypothetical protein
VVIWRRYDVDQCATVSSGAGVDTRMSRPSGATEGHREVEELARRAWSCEGGGSG